MENSDFGQNTPIWVFGLIFEQLDNPLTKSYMSTMPKSCWKPCPAVS